MREGYQAALVPCGVDRAEFNVTGYKHLKYLTLKYFQKAEHRWY
jgi:hypothetical protein